MPLIKPLLISLVGMIGKRVRLVFAKAMHPQAVWDLLGETGTIIERDEVVTEKNRVTIVTDIWLVSFDSGKRLWSAEDCLKEIDD